MRRIFYFIGLLLISNSLAYGATQLKDEGTSQGYINVVDCVGAGIACTKSGITGTLTVGGGGGGDHDPVTVSDTAEIDHTLTGQQLSSALVASSIDETKLDASVNASLDLADSALQSETDTFDDVVGRGAQSDSAPIIDVTSTEALLVRADADGGDYLRVDTTNGRVIVGNGGSVGAYNPQLFIPMVGTQNILIDGRTNQRAIDTGTMRFLQTPSIPNTRALTFDVNANSQELSHASVVDFTADGIASGETVYGYETLLNTGTATGGRFHGLSISKAGQGTIEVYGLHANADVNPIMQNSSIAFDMDSASTTAGGDVLASFISTASDVTMFASDNDTVTVGDASKFNSITFDLDTNSSKEITPTFEYSTGVGTWSTFTPTDTTSGMQQSGAISWNLADIPSWATGTGSEYLIRITRTRNGAMTAPIEDLVQIALGIEYHWNSSGSLLVKDVSLEGATDNDYQTLITVVDPTADRTVTLGDVDIDFTAPTDNYILTYDSGTKTWSGEASAGGAETNSLEADGAVGIADTELYIGTGAGTGNYAVMSGDATLANTGAITIGNDKILEVHLKAVDAASDEECLTYESTTGDFEWQTCSSGSGDITSVGDVASGAAFDGTQGTTLTFNNAGGDGTLAYDGIMLSWDKAINMTGGDLDVTGQITSSAGVYTSDIGIGVGPNDIFFSTNTDGQLIIQAQGDGNDEAIAVDLDDTANTGVFSSSTGLSNLTFSGISLTSSTVNIDLLDGVGAVDMDYGSADITDHTFTTDGTGTAEIVLPAGAIDSTEILDDTLLEVDLKAVDAAVDEECLTYESTTGDFEWQSCGAGGATSWTDIGDPTADTTIAMAGYKTTFTSTLDGGSMLYVLNTDQDAATETRMFDFASYALDDPEVVYYLAVADDDDTAVIDLNFSQTKAVFGPPIILDSSGLNESGIKLTDDADGALTILGMGNGFDEDLTFNFDDTTNEVDVTSSTGVANVQFNSMDVTVPTEAYDATGWDSDNSVPTKDAVRDKIETLSAGSSATDLNLPVYSAKLTGAFVVFTPPTADACTAGAQIDAGDGNWRLLFDATTDECATWQFVVPSNYVSTPLLQIYYTMTSATTNEIEFEAAIMCVSDNDGADINTASFSNVAVISETVDGTVGDMQKVTVTLTDDSCAAGDVAFVVLSTDSNDATADDATGDREVVGVAFDYT